MEAAPTPTVILLLGSVPSPTTPLGLPLLLLMVAGPALAVVVGAILRLIGIVRSAMTLLSLALLLAVLPASLYLVKVGWQTTTQAKQEILAQVAVRRVTPTRIELAVSLSKPALLIARYGTEVDRLGLVGFTSDPASVAQEHKLILDNLSPKTLYFIRLQANGQPIGKLLRLETK